MRRKITYDAQRDYYVLLGIDSHVTADELRQAYRRAVRAVHPDLNPDRTEWATEQLQLVNEAYDVLSKPDLRRQYDHLRWAYAPHVPRGVHWEQPRTRTRSHGYRSPFSSSSYRSDRPWWEQASRQPSSGSPANNGTARGDVAEPQPYWIAVASWLKANRLGALEPAWLTLVGLWRSPYGGLLMVLGVALAVNIVLLIAAFTSPDGDLNPMNNLFDTQIPTLGPSGANGPIATPDSLHLICPDPTVQITQPVNNDLVGDRFSVYGVLNHPEMESYTLKVGYVGTQYNRNVVPGTWTTIRAPSPDQSGPEPPINGDLLYDESINLRTGRTGYYAVRVEVTLRNGTQLRPCDVIVLRP